MELEQLATEWPWIIPVVITVLGLLVGSFLNVVVYRLPKIMERDWRKQCEVILSEPSSIEDAGQTFNLAFPNSHCPECKAPIKAFQNIPVISWLLLRGRCANCKTAISARYPAVEFLTGLLSLIVAVKFGYSPITIAAVGLTWALIALSFIDIDTHYLFDDITIPLLWAGLLVNLVTGWHSVHDVVIGAMAGYLILWSVFWLFKLATGKEGMGYGDFKLLAALGAWLGWQMLPLIVILSTLVGAFVGITMIAIGKRERSQEIPFGPYLAAAGFIALIWGDLILSNYLQVAKL